VSNNWSNWANDLSSAYNLVNTINKAIPNLNNAQNTYQQDSAILAQIQAALAASGLANNPVFEQFASGLQTTIQGMTNEIVDPATGQLVPVSEVNGQINFTIYPSATQLFGQQIASWLPGMSQNGNFLSSNDGPVPMSWSDFLNNTIWSPSPGQPDSDQFQYTLPNGDSVTLTVTLDSNNDWSITVNAPAQDFAQDLQMAPSATLGNGLTNYMKSW